MKQKLLTIKTLLVAAGLCAGASAWATDKEVTLNCASSITIVGHNPYGTDGSSFSSLIRLNSYKGEGGAGAVAFALDENWDASKVKSATLQLYMNSKDDKNRSGDIYIKSLTSYPDLSSNESTSYSEGKHIVYKETSSTNKRYTFSATTQATVTASCYNNSDPKTGQYFDVDLTSYIQSLSTKSAGDLIYFGIDISDWAFVGSIGAYGNTNAPKLVITYTDETLYTASFTANSGDITPAITIYSDAGHNSVVTNGALFDETTYYYRAVLRGYNDYEGSFTVSGANPSESFTMTAATPITSLVVKAKIGSSTYDIQTLALDDKYEGDVVTFNYPRYFLVGTSLYEVSQSAHSGGYYYWSYKLDGNDAVVEYNTLVSGNVVYYAEGENILTQGNANNSNIRCSDGKGGYFTTAGEPITLKNLAAGRYKIQSFVWGGSGTTYTFKAGDDAVSTIPTTGSLNSSTSFFVLDAANDITLQANENNSGRVLDCVYIEKYDTYLYNGDFSNSTWNAGWSGTGSNKKDAFISNTHAWFDGLFTEMWAGNGTTFSKEANLYQTIKALPAGSYILSANIVNNVASSGGVLYAKVGDNPEVTVEAAGLDAVTAKSIVFTVNSTSDVVIGFKTTGITGGTGWIALDDFSLANGVISATIGAKGWTTFASPYALDLSNLEGATAYYASAVGENSVTMTSTESDAVAAGEGLMLKGTAGATITIPVVASGAAIDGNLLKGCTAETVLDANANNYVLVNNGAAAEFQCLDENGATIPAGKAYLDAGTGARSLSVVFADKATAVKSISAAKEDGEVYNLAGQRVAAPQKGLYIVNGRKVIVK